MMTPNYDYGVQINYMLFLFFIFSLSLCCQYNQKAGIALFDSLNMTYDWIWACPNWCAQNRYIDVENSQYQPPLPECFHTRTVITCLKLTIKILQGVKYVESYK